MQPLLILREDYDLSAGWLADRLRARGRDVCDMPAAMLGAETLRWHHRLGTDGTQFALGCPDGRSLAPGDYAGVVNRLHYLPLALLARIGGADEDYARSELYALFLSWMAALPQPVFNPPTPQGLAGNWRHPSAWTMLAQAAGFAVVPWRQDTTSDPDTNWTIAERRGEMTVIVVGERVILPADAAGVELAAPVAAACCALARAADVGLLGVRLAPDTALCEGWRFIAANLLPDLHPGGEALVDAVAAAFDA